MIKSIYVKNFVLIDELHLDFHNSFSCFTGETGAGKSLLIDAISILCGGRVSPQYIQKGAEKAFIEASIKPDIKDHPALELLRENGYELEEDCFIISREFTIEGKSSTKINHRNTTLSFIKEVMSQFVDIHSQHDTQYLLNPKYHLSLLDAYVNENNKLNEIKVLYKEYQKLSKEKEIFEKEEANPDDLEFLKFQLEEIETLDIKEDEIETLENQIQEMSSFEKVASNLQTSLKLIQESGYEKLYDVGKYLSESENEEVSSIKEEILNSYYTLEEQIERLSSFLQTMEFNEEEFNTFQQRLFEIKKLIRKHGSSYSNLIEKKEELTKRIKAIENRQVYLDELSFKCTQSFDIYRKAAKQMSILRKEKAFSLKEMIEKELIDLQLANACFDVQFEEGVYHNGIDKVEFMISMNIGENLKPLAKVASGGELSRLMLGLKSIFTSLAGIETIIFDEIDNGVSGSVAHSIGKKMQHLSKYTQVFAVTHLSPVAVWADCHYLVEKKSVTDHTNTNIKELNEDERIRELAMLANGNTNESSLNAAKELYLNVKN